MSALALLDGSMAQADDDRIPLGLSEDLPSSLLAAFFRQVPIEQLECAADDIKLVGDQVGGVVAIGFRVEITSPVPRERPMKVVGIDTNSNSQYPRFSMAQ